MPVEARAYPRPLPNPEWLGKLSEEILEPDLPIVDPHHHLWDHPGSRYLLDDILADVNSGHNIVATVFVRNLYCRFVCPVGAALGIISQVTTVFRIKRWSECKSCKICEKTCQWGAIRGPKIVASECVRCDDCERLYMDQKKCPHWLILFRRKGNTAVPASTLS